VSYILDALKKASEQRDVHTPAMRRLFTPVPEIAEVPRWRIALVGGGAALAGAAVVALVWMLWPTATPTPTATPMIVVDRPDAAPATAALPERETRQPVQPPPPPAPPIVRTTPAPARPKAEKRPAPATPRAVERRQSPDDPPAPSRPTVEPPVIAALRPVAPPAEDPTPAPDLAPVPAPAPLPAPAPVRTPRSVTPTPAAPTGPRTASPPRTEAGTAMKLEVIVYSDERARRLAFINGRKYVEGDTLLDGATIQEIQPNAVVILDSGRRVLLRP
jgi:hypothetical protein